MALTWDLNKDGGLHLSTYGHVESAFAALTILDRQRLRFSDKDKVIVLPPALHQDEFDDMATQ